MGTDSFAGIWRLLIDGNNLLHRRSGGADDGALRGLLAQLRLALPAQVTTIVMLDGHSAAGTGRQAKIAPNLDVRHSGSLSADAALLNLVRDQAAGTTLVSDDRALRDRAMNLGAHTQRLEWLERVLSGASPRSTIGGGIRRPQVGAKSEADESERPPWQPGRGATKKRGNPRRTRRHS